MSSLVNLKHLFLSLFIVLACSGAALAQRASGTANRDSAAEFGPVMRAYLGYLSNEQEVVDDRASRREITPGYYHRNSDRIRALRQMALRLVRQSGNDYVPELEAVTVDEFGTLFERPPKPGSLRADEVVANKFRFLAVLHSGEVFYLFARLDPYEQAELMKRQENTQITSSPILGNSLGAGQSATRPRRAGPK
jgi:hypothetical protein